jgi:hypothetical protein
MGQYVRLEVCRLGKLLIAAVKRTHIRPVPSMYTDVCSEVEIK